MPSKAIKIKEENYKWLLEISSNIQKKEGRPISFDDALNEIRKTFKKRGVKKWTI